MYDIDSAQERNLRFVSGETIEIAIKFQDSDQSDVDLTGCTAAMQVRTGYQAANPTIAVSTTASAAGSITLNAKGDILITIAKTASAIPAASYVYDLALTFPSGVTKYLLRGRLQIEPRVTQ